jgi:hypothetical protein
MLSYFVVDKDASGDQKMCEDGKGLVFASVAGRCIKAGSVGRRDGKKRI